MESLNGAAAGGGLPEIAFAPARPDVRPGHRRGNRGGRCGRRGQQWHEHGVLGIATDLGAAGVSTWDDTKQLGEDVGHAASSVWHGVTSLF